ncbi:LysR family transcriptional regulator [Pseudomonas sp. PS02288]|uniref:LysR family transcriptional regulator n=1 Tax=Pseudomonas sp. PS02288 TaxID=2991443 RepID=UPI00249C4AF1|nr:LysR family transcriptional regulator [Pseudomonas sp. PS02288]
MDRFLAMQLFTRIVEMGAFGRAGESLGLAPASSSQLIRQLESHLGVQLLQRTTRQVSPTVDGAEFYERCVRLLADLDDAEGSFSEARRNPRGKLRIDLSHSLARLVVIPRLPAFCSRYPQIELEVGTSDRTLDLIREGVDCVLRGGAPLDPGLVARPVTQLTQVTCASPAYLTARGVPRTLAQLDDHRAIDFIGSSGQRFELEFQVAGATQTRRLPAQIAVNGADAYVAACEAGLGLIQVPVYHVTEQLRAGSLVEVLADCRPPVYPLSVVYPPHRQLSRRVRVFVDWLVELFEQPNWMARPGP